MLDDLGLVATIEWAGEEFGARTGTQCRLDLTPDDIVVDPDTAVSIFRIFQETLTNVARHANAKEVQARLAIENGNLTLEVHDNGSGIPREKLQKGRSLGILGMRERATLLGGDLSITGSPGQGTVVRVWIPQASGLLKERDRDQVLVSDDHAVLRTGVTKILMHGLEGAVCGEAGNAEEILEQAQNHEWDLVILDINMPGRSGIEVLREIRRLRPGFPCWC
jgi:hypothetical protein